MDSPETVERVDGLSRSSLEVPAVYTSLPSGGGEVASISHLNVGVTSSTSQLHSSENRSSDRGRDRGVVLR
jgi:hypothetical protein